MLSTIQVKGQCEYMRIEMTRIHKGGLFQIHGL